MADKQPAKKKRRIRPASDESSALTSTAGTKKELAEETKSTAPKKRSGIGKPFQWISRHLVPRYFRGSVGELKLVTWPTRKQSRQLTLAVILFAAVFATIVSLLDAGLDKVFKKVFLHE